MKLVRIIGLTFAVAGTLTLLAACGGDDEKSGDGATPTATEGQAGADVWTDNFSSILDVLMIR